MSLGKIDQLRRRSQPFNQIFAQYNQDNTLYFCISLFLFWLSFIYLAVAAVEFAVLQNHFPVLLLRQNNPFPKKIVRSHKKLFKKLFKKFVSEQPFFFKNFASLRRCQAPNMCQMTFLSSVIFVYCLRSETQDNCTVPRFITKVNVNININLDKSHS